MRSLSGEVYAEVRTSRTTAVSKGVTVFVAPYPVTLRSVVVLFDDSVSLKDDDAMSLKLRVNDEVVHEVQINGDETSVSFVVQKPLEKDDKVVLHKSGSGALPSAYVRIAYYNG